MLKKKLIFLLFIVFVNNGFSHIKFGLLKKIERCELLFDRSQIYPGNSFEMEVLTVLKDSTRIRSSDAVFTINFADYNIKLDGAIEIEKKTRKTMTMRVLNEAYENPEVFIYVELRRKKSINWQIRLPVNFDVVQEIAFKGEDGYDPRSTTENGYRKVPLTDRINIEYIDNEQTLTNNSDPNIIGGKGPDLEVFISLVEGKNGEYIKVQVNHESGEQYFRYLKCGEGQLDIKTIGGKGGISKSGGQGGDGGNVNVYIKPNAKPYFKQVFIVNHGGDGGELWRPKVDGKQHGPYGDDGEVEIFEWN